MPARMAVNAGTDGGAPIRQKFLIFTPYLLSTIRTIQSGANLSFDGLRVIFKQDVRASCES
jgi:hypothetical protein